MSMDAICRSRAGRGSQDVQVNVGAQSPQRFGQSRHAVGEAACLIIYPGHDLENLQNSPSRFASLDLLPTTPALPHIWSL
jgi:hypothetical protein